MQTLKNKAFRVSIQWNALVRKPLSLERGSFTVKQSLKTIYSIKNYGSLSFACFYHFFESKSVRSIWFSF